MALVFIPTMMQNLTHGVTDVQISGRTVRDIIEQLEVQFPGMRNRLLQDDDFQPDVAVSVDGEIAFDIMERVGDNSEIHFIPPISGGRS
jgi:molybdopterin synthase sulfur carrier subunit